MSDGRSTTIDSCGDEREILVVGAPSVAREALCSLLEQELVARVHKAGDVASAMHLLEQSPPAVLVMLSWALDGFRSEWLRTLRVAMPDSSLLVWVGVEPEPASPPAQADLVMSLHDAPGDFLDRLTEGTGGRAPRRHTSTMQPLLDALTERELGVVELMTEGITANRALSDELGVSENTVKFHVGNILSKLGLHKRAEVVAYALREASEIRARRLSAVDRKVLEWTG